ncbi:MAG: tyrosine--tRNA ligase [Dehalococcoidia bacterium]|nr:tyrosine--tRNA ligase [Dehalococcoidia bacterium]
MNPSQDWRRLLKRGVAEIIVEDEMVKLLESGRPLRLKQGFDPSRPDIHLGHVVGLRKLRQFQELGHQVILIVGDWTAQIGDPSGQSATRSMLSAEEVRANAETYMRQFFKVINREKTQVVWQSEWFAKFGLADVVRLTSKFTVAQFLARDDFAKRFAAGRPIAITELLYPLMQAYDSVQVQADVEFGGTDQKFNCLVGRELQQMMGQRQQQVFLMPLLVGTDGVQKMSKSLGNYIAVEEPPDQMYGKVMSIPDSLMMGYFELLTDISDDELEEYRKKLSEQCISPMLLKKRLAREIVAQFHGEAPALEAEAGFERVFQKREAPREAQEVTRELLERLQEFSRRGIEPMVAMGTVGQPPREYLVSLSLLLVEAGVVKSRGEAKRLIQQRAVEVDDSTAINDDCRISLGSTIRVGKRRFLKVAED